VTLDLEDRFGGGRVEKLRHSYVPPIYAAGQRHIAKKTMEQNIKIGGASFTM
jgi:hypothetical protein